MEDLDYLYERGNQLQAIAIQQKNVSEFVRKYIDALPDVVEPHTLVTNMTNILFYMDVPNVRLLLHKFKKRFLDYDSICTYELELRFALQASVPKWEAELALITFVEYLDKDTRSSKLSVMQDIRDMDDKMRNMYLDFGYIKRVIRFTSDLHNNELEPLIEALDDRFRAFFRVAKQDGDFIGHRFRTAMFYMEYSKVEAISKEMVCLNHLLADADAAMASLCASLNTIPLDFPKKLQAKLTIFVSTAMSARINIEECLNTFTDASVWKIVQSTVCMLRTLVEFLDAFDSTKSEVSGNVMGVIVIFFGLYSMGLADRLGRTTRVKRTPPMFVDDLLTATSALSYSQKKQPVEPIIMEDVLNCIASLFAYASSAFLTMPFAYGMEILKKAIMCDLPTHKRMKEVESRLVSLV